MTFSRKIKRKQAAKERESHDYRYSHCCGLEMVIKIIDNKAYYACAQCGKTKPYTEKEPAARER